MNVHQKINFRANAINLLSWNQYRQLMERNLLALAPYYLERLLRQAEQVQESKRFKKIFGKSRYEFENNI